MHYTIDFNKIDTKKYYYDEVEAKKVIKFCESYCKIVDGIKAGEPMILLEWQRQLVSNLFGWKDKKTGFRKFKKVHLQIPRKNGKSTFAASIGLYYLLCSGEEFAQCYLAAADREQGRIALDIIKALIEKQPKFAKVLKVNLNVIKYGKTNSFIKVISSESKTKLGYNSAFILLDEIAFHPNDKLYQVLTTSVAAKDQPIIFTATTAGTDRNGIGYELFDKACKIILGVLDDPEFLPFVFMGDENLPIDDIGNLTKANPSLGYGVKLDYLLKAAQTAKDMPSQLAPFKMFHLNLWSDATTTFIKSDQWNACKAEFTEDDLLGQECYLSYDLSSNKDLTSVNLLFPPSTKNPKFRTLSYNFLPMEAANDQNISAGKVFLIWADDPTNNLYLTLNRTTDFDFILEKISELNEKFQIKKVTYDRFMSSYINQEVSKVVDCELVEFVQNFKNFSPSTKMFESMVLEKQIEHSDNKVLNWTISNLRVMQDNHENLKPIKSKSSDKIDSVISLIMNFGMYIKDLSEPEEQEYTGDGFFMV